MVSKNSIVSASELKGLLAGEQDILKEFVRTVVQHKQEKGSNKKRGQVFL